jgi:hypothetical protein
MVVPYSSINSYMHSYLQAAKAKASQMASQCSITPCTDCLENYAYASPIQAMDSKQATVMWASQKQSYVYGECMLHINMCISSISSFLFSWQTGYSHVSSPICMCSTIRTRYKHTDSTYVTALFTMRDEFLRAVRLILIF